MLYYISELYKKFVTRNNALSTKPVKIFNHTVDEIEVSIVDQQNQLKQIPSGAFYFTGSFVKKAKATPIFLTTDYTVSGTTLTFKYSTYTYEFLNLVIGENVPIQVEIGYKDADGEHVILQDTAYANQRYYVEGMPDPSHVAEYYTKTETDAAIAAAISGIELSGYVTTEELEEGLATKQNTIDEDNKLPYSLISDTPEIPLSTSQLTNDSGFITETALEGLATETYVNEAISGKADETALTGHTSDTVIHVTAEDKVAWSGKQDAITVDNKLDYALLSGTPEVPTVEWGGISGTLSAQTDLQDALNAKANATDIPLSTSQLTNDSGFVDQTVLETALSGKQDAITNDNKLDYNLLSGTPTIPLSTSQLTNDSGFVTSSVMEDALSGKQDLITADEWLPAGYVRMELDPYEYGDPEFTVDTAVNMVHEEALEALSGVDAVSGALSGKQDAITNDNKLDYSLLSSTPTIPVVPTNVSDFTNDAGYQTAQDVQDAISGKADTSALTAHTSDTTIHVTSADKTAWDGKQDAITNDNKLDYSLLSGTPTVPTKTSDLQNDSGFITDADLSGKQDVIDNNNKLDYALISGAPTVPTSTSQLTNDSDFIDQTALTTALSSKQDVIDNNNKLDYALLSGTPNPMNVEVASIVSPNVNFLGKQIQKVDPTVATSGSVTITFSNLNSIPNGYAPTCELHIATNGNISTITLPSGTAVINMPETLDYIGGKAITYHVITFRAMKDIEGNIHVCANYNYKYEEDYL